MYAKRIPAMKAAKIKPQDAIHADKCDAVVYVPPELAKRLLAHRAKLQDGDRPESSDPAKLELFTDKATDRSRIARRRIASGLRYWLEEMTRENQSIVSRAVNAPELFEAATDLPASFEENDVSEETQRRAAIWSKVLPFIVLQIIDMLLVMFFPQIALWLPQMLNPA